jgi:hypothetical protein
MQNPITLIFRALRLWLEGRLQMEHDLAGQEVEDREECFSAFRKIAVRRSSKPEAFFQVRFRFKNFSAATNRWLSSIPIPLIVAQPGFRSKTWLLGEQTGDFIGRYEFDTVDAAEAYWCSLPLSMMKRRAAPGSLTHEILALQNEEIKEGAEMKAVVRQIPQEANR